MILSIRKFHKSQAPLPPASNKAMLIKTKTAQSGKAIIKTSLYLISIPTGQWSLP